MLVYGSVCSGIEAATVAWHPLGWRPAFFSEIEAFPRSVLAHHYPDTPLHGDFTTIQANDYAAIDLLVGGTPCQSFSIAGPRGGLADDRGNLALEYLRLADRLRPRWVVWENVPGVLSSLSHAAPDSCAPPDPLDLGCEGAEVELEDEYDSEELHAFSCFLAGLSGLGYGFAYRVFDAQYFGLAQRRERVFVVGYLGDWRRAAAVLFERHSLQGHPAPRRKAGPPVATSSPFGVDGGSDIGHALMATTTATGRLDPSMHTYVAHTLRSDGFDASEDGCGFATAAVAMTLGANSDRNHLEQEYTTSHSSVRRLTPRECERLQGFPDDYTLVPHSGKPAADGPRYKALGNSMAVPVMRWIGERIATVEAALRPSI